ncbi:tryptophan-rich antigen [Plasmodium malariae]|uniref:Tryptophan-rich antigen n=1 Tax=Plasmodium malariae TaxID=5858 RepID=A0A1D3JM41_PLAMA|nr:tryptophan-rich antigen [Plasmodium malariae]SBT87549.1 tryptophan-rich antigen [Plasmodium malariae]
MYTNANTNTNTRALINNTMNLSVILYIIFLSIILSAAPTFYVNTSNTTNELKSSLIFKKNNGQLTETWKTREWNKWMKNMDVFYELFSMNVEEKISYWEWMKQRSWNEWLKFMNNKWSHYNENIYVEYRSEVFWICKSWVDTNWTEWIEKNGKSYMTIDWEKWIQEVHSSFCKLVINEWDQWTKEKINEWNTSKWKLEEDEYWDINGNNNDRKKKIIKDWLNYYRWRKRINRESDEWVTWIKEREERYKNHCNNIWLEWEKSKIILFGDWMNSFIKRWIIKKQWNVWLNEKHNYVQERIKRYNKKKKRKY